MSSTASHSAYATAAACTRWIACTTVPATGGRGGGCAGPGRLLTATPPPNSQAPACSGCWEARLQHSRRGHSATRWLLHLHEEQQSVQQSNSQDIVSVPAWVHGTRRALSRTPSPGAKPGTPGASLPALPAGASLGASAALAASERPTGWPSTPAERQDVGRRSAGERGAASRAQALRCAGMLAGKVNAPCSGVRAQCMQPGDACMLPYPQHSVRRETGSAARPRTENKPHAGQCTHAGPHRRAAPSRAEQAPGHRSRLAPTRARARCHHHPAPRSHAGTCSAPPPRPC